MRFYIRFFFFKQKTAYEIVSGDWSSDVCSSDLTRVADRLQIAGDDFVERRSFRAGDLDDAVSRRRERHIGDDSSNVVRRDGLEQAGREPDRVSIRTLSGDAAEEFQKLGRADDGVGDAGGLDQFLLG